MEYESKEALSFSIVIFDSRFIFSLTCVIFFCILEAHGATSDTWLQSGSWSLVCSSKGPFFASYESPAQLVVRREATEYASESPAFYGSMEL